MPRIPRPTRRQAEPISAHFTVVEALDVARAAEAANRQALFRLGQYIRKTAKNNARKRKTISDPFQNWHSHVGRLRHAIAYGVDRDATSVVIGPKTRHAHGTAPRALEYGGKTKFLVPEYSFTDQYGNRLNDREIRRRREVLSRNRKAARRGRSQAPRQPAPRTRTQRELHRIWAYYGYGPGAVKRKREVSANIKPRPLLHRAAQASIPFMKDAWSRVYMSNFRNGRRYRGSPGSGLAALHRAWGGAMAPPGGVL